MYKCKEMGNVNKKYAVLNKFMLCIARLWPSRALTVHEMDCQREEIVLVSYVWLFRCPVL